MVITSVQSLQGPLEHQDRIATNPSFQKQERDGGASPYATAELNILSPEEQLRVLDKKE